MSRRTPPTPGVTPACGLGSGCTEGGESEQDNEPCLYNKATAVISILLSFVYETFMHLLTQEQWFSNYLFNTLSAPALFPHILLWSDNTKTLVLQQLTRILRLQDTL